MSPNSPLLTARAPVLRSPLEDHRFEGCTHHILNVADLLVPLRPLFWRFLVRNVAVYSIRSPLIETVEGAPGSLSLWSRVREVPGGSGRIRLLCFVFSPTSMNIASRAMHRSMTLSSASVLSVLSRRRLRARFTRVRDWSEKSAYPCISSAGSRALSGRSAMLAAGCTSGKGTCKSPLPRVVNVRKNGSVATTAGRTPCQ